MIPAAAPARHGFIEILAALWHFLDDVHGFHADRAGPQQQVDHLALVVREAVGVELLRNGRILGFLFLVALQDPFQGRIGAETVLLSPAPFGPLPEALGFWDIY